MDYQDLSKRERQIMDIIHQKGELSVSEVIDALSNPSSYNSIRMLMNILEKKGHLQHRQQGNKYIYYATIQKERAKKNALDHLIKTYFDKSAPSIVSSLLSDHQFSKEDLDEISRLIEEAKGGDGMTDWFNIFLVNIAVKSSLIILFGLMLHALLKKWNAAHRYVVWKMLCGLLLLLPLAYLVAWNPVLFSPEPMDIVQRLPIPYHLQESPDGSGVLTSGQLAPRSDAPTAEPEIAANSRLSPTHPGLPFSIVLIGGLVLGFAILIEVIMLSYIIRKSKAGSNTMWTERMIFHQKALGLESKVQLQFSDHIKIPFTYGSKHPVILIPTSKTTWTKEEIDTIILHELCHIRQGDFTFNLILQAIKCLFWWNPLCWIAIRKTRLVCEQACDELVVNSGIPHLAYAGQLVKLAEHFQGKGNWAGQLSVPMLRNTDLKNRVLQLIHLAKNEQRRAWPDRPAWLFGAALFLIPVLFCNLPANQLELNTFGVSTLLFKLEKPSITSKVESLRALGIGKHKNALIPVLKHLKHHDPRVRAAAAWALGEFGDDQAITPLVNLINDKVDCVQERALLSLGTFGYTRTFYAVMNGRKDSSPEVRKATLWTLYRIGCMPAFHLVSSHLNDPDEGVRHLAGRLIRNFDSKKLQKWILRLELEHSRDFAYEHFSGIQKMGCLELFTRTIVRPGWCTDGNEKSHCRNTR